MPNTRPSQEMTASQPWAPPPQNFGMNAGGFRPNQFMPPQYQYDNYYQPPPMDKPTRQAPPSFGREPPVGPPPAATIQPQPSIVTKVLLLSL